MADFEKDDAPKLDAHFFENAQVRIGRRIVREASDTIAKRGRGRPPKGPAAKVQQTLKLSPEVLEFFRGTGEGWQARIDAVLLAHVRYARASGAPDERPLTLFEKMMTLSRRPAKARSGETETSPDNRKRA